MLKFFLSRPPSRSLKVKKRNRKRQRPRRNSWCFRRQRRRRQRPECWAAPKGRTTLGAVRKASNIRDLRPSRPDCPGSNWTRPRRKRPMTTVMIRRRKAKAAGAAPGSLSIRSKWPAAHPPATWACSSAPHRRKRNSLSSWRKRFHAGGVGGATPMDCNSACWSAPVVAITRASRWARS